LYHQANTPRAGAIVQFCGTVRNHNKDAQVDSLEYESYVEMAEAHILKIAHRVHKATPVWNASAVHRTGMLKIGDVAVCVTVAASHRDAAFVACRRIIDELKDEAPIWKRESLSSGDRRWIEEGFSPGSKGEA
jgi:molybdopterin synthase catalytic subunit